LFSLYCFRERKEEEERKKLGEEKVEEDDEDDDIVGGGNPWKTLTSEELKKKVYILVQEIVLVACLQMSQNISRKSNLRKIKRVFRIAGLDISGGPLV
jgi:hypothetical protein